MSPLSSVSDDRFTLEEGELVRHFVGMRCWCQGPQGHPDPNCSEHELGGWIYRDERRIWGLVTDVKQNKELAQIGLWEPGDCVFSPTSDAVVSDGDKIVFTWALPHGSGDVRLRRDDTSDRLTYEAVRSLWCEDEDKVRYAEGTDFYLAGKEIVWDWEGKAETASAPAEGRRYVVKYTGYLEWIVFLPPFERVSHGERIGPRVGLRKKHLMEAT